MTPYYEHAGITIYHGDCRETLGAIQSGSVSLVVTSPPYNQMTACEKPPSGLCLRVSQSPESRRKVACAPPTHHAFDIDIYDCPCGHMYGDHDYTWLRTAVHPEKAMVIIRCETCGSVPCG